MAKTGIDGYGATLSYSATVDGSYTEVAQIRDIDLGDLSRDTKEVKHQDNSQVEKYPAGHLDLGEWSVDFESNFTNYSTLVTMHKAATESFWKYTDSIGNTVTAYGFVNSLTLTNEMEGTVTGELTITLDGSEDITLTAYTP